MLRKIRLLPFLLRWSWAYHGGVGGMSDEVRLKRLARLKPENGPKQVILTQRAAAHWRLGQTQDAVTLFRLARESELDWGGRKRRDVSEYLVEYCAYCVNLGSGPIISQRSVHLILFQTRHMTAGIVVLFQGHITQTGAKSGEPEGHGEIHALSGSIFLPRQPALSAKFKPLITRIFPC